MILKQRRITKGMTNGRHRTRHSRAPSVMLSSPSETASQGTAQTTQTKEEDEDDEDTIFRVVAQRIATTLKRDNTSNGYLSQSHTPTAGAAIRFGGFGGSRATTTTLRDAHSLQWSTDFAAPLGGGSGGVAAIHDEEPHISGSSAQEDLGGGGARPSTCLFSESGHNLASSLDRADIMMLPHRQSSSI